MTLAEVRPLFDTLLVFESYPLDTDDFLPARLTVDMFRLPNIMTPVEVTKANIKSTVVADGFYKVSDICKGAIASACKKAGLQ